MLKKEARKIFRKQKEALSFSDRMKWDDLLLIQLQTMELPYIDTAFSYYPVEENAEINSFLFTDYLHFKNPNLTICYPRMQPETTTMEAVVCKADTIFETNPYNIPEPLETTVADPADIDLVIVPLLAFDEEGVRVGYGKGYYDRFLKECREDCIKIGFSYFDAVDRIEDRDEFDVPLNFCITPQRIYVF